MTEEYEPTVWDNFTMNHNVKNTDIKLTIKDTAGQEDFSNLLSCSFEGTDAFIITMAAN